MTNELVRVLVLSVPHSNQIMKASTLHTWPNRLLDDNATPAPWYEWGQGTQRTQQFLVERKAIKLWCDLATPAKLSAKPLQSSGFLSGFHHTNTLQNETQLTLLSDSALAAHIDPAFLGNGLLGPATGLPLQVGGGVGFFKKINLNFDMSNVRTNLKQAFITDKHVLHSCSTTMTLVPFNSCHSPRPPMGQAFGSRTFSAMQLSSQHPNQTTHTDKSFKSQQIHMSITISLNFQPWKLKLQLNASSLIRFQPHSQGAAGTCPGLPMVADCKRWLNLVISGWLTNQSVAMPCNVPFLTPVFLRKASAKTLFFSFLQQSHLGSRFCSEFPGIGNSSPHRPPLSAFTCADRESNWLLITRKSESVEDKPNTLKRYSHGRQFASNSPMIPNNTTW